MTSGLACTAGRGVGVGSSSAALQKGGAAALVRAAGNENGKNDGSS